MSRVLIIAGICIACLLSVYAIYSSCQNQKKIGYVVTQKVFSDFKGTKELDAKLKEEQNKHRNELDSLQVLIQALEKYNTEKVRLEQTRIEFSRLRKKYSSKNQELTQQYTAQLWKQLNQYINDYGQANGYAYILGAEGTGTIMFADSSQNRTKEVLEYSNSRYDGK